MLSKLNWAIFWALVATFIVIVSWFFLASDNEFFRGFHFLIFLASSGAVFILLGVTLIFITVKEKAGGMFALQRKKWGWALTGSIIAILAVFPLGMASTVFVAMAKDEFE